MIFLDFIFKFVHVAECGEDIIDILVSEST